MQFRFFRISQADMDVYLKALNEADDEANTVQEAASNLQHKFQELIADDKEMHDKACKGELKVSIDREEYLPSGTKIIIYKKVVKKLTE